MAENQADLFGNAHEVPREVMNEKVGEVGQYIRDNFDMEDFKVELGVSGGKDSTACYLLLMELGVDFVPMFADTGNEHPSTIEHAMTLSERTGGPEVIQLAREYPEELFAKRREKIQETWSKPHTIRMGARRGDQLPPVPQEIIDEALAVLKPSGNRFLDMALLHGMWPQRRAQFCTMELKLEPVREKIAPWLDEGFDVLMVSGVRADESAKRSEYPRHEPDRNYISEVGDVIQFRPILGWTAAECFAMHKRHGVEPNPLYKQGMGRVGCMPCIFATQPELVEIYKRFPEEIDRIARWEELAAKVSRWAIEHGGERLAFLGSRQLETKGPQTMMYGIHELVRWVGEKPQHDLEEAPKACSSKYGLCE